MQFAWLSFSLTRQTKKGAVLLLPFLVLFFAGKLAVVLQQLFKPAVFSPFVC
jgi:hypothetical protein